MQMLPKKVVGDGGIGKTAMLVSYAEGHFPEEYVPTVFDAYTARIPFEGVERTVVLHDTFVASLSFSDCNLRRAGQEDFDQVRSLGYGETQLFLVCYDVSNKDSYSNIITKWKPELDLHGHNKTPKMLIGLKKDIRDNAKTLRDAGKTLRDCVSMREGGLLGQKLRWPHMECSALTRNGLEDIFLRVIEILVTGARVLPKPKKKGIIGALKAVSGSSSDEAVDLNRFAGRKPRRHHADMGADAAADAAGVGGDSDD